MALAVPTDGLLDAGPSADSEKQVWAQCIYGAGT